jgi:hypothetical protein
MDHHEREAHVRLGSSPMPLPKPNRIEPHPAVSEQRVDVWKPRRSLTTRAPARICRVACEASALPLSYAPSERSLLGLLPATGPKSLDPENHARPHAGAL